MKLKIITGLFLLSTNIAMAGPTALAVAATQGVTTQILQPTEIASAHGINIANSGPGTKVFNWTISLCPETQPEHCQTLSDHLSLAPGQKWSHVYTFRNMIVFKAVGSKPISAKTEISGAAYSVAYDVKYVDVHY